MREIWRLGWDRFNLVTAILGDVQGRVIALVFYFTILMPFGIGSRLFSDPLRQRLPSDNTDNKSFWVERHPIPTDLDSAKRQG
ncbi:MAG: hypothetical protein HXY40_05815 [Chloroflexi bacterium]|nr:hypothetical protein [Chloroflexota bacterium]